MWKSPQSYLKCTSYKKIPHKCFHLNHKYRSVHCNMLYITVLLFFLEEIRIHLIIRVQLKLLLLFIPVAVTTAGMTFLSSTLHFVQWLPTPTKNKIGNLTRGLLIYVYGNKRPCVYFINLILSMNQLKCLAQGTFFFTLLWLLLWHFSCGQKRHCRKKT